MATRPTGDDPIARAREALNRPGVDAVVEGLPAPWREIVAEARAALETSDPEGALEALGRRHADVAPPSDPAGLVQALWRALFDASETRELDQAAELSADLLAEARRLAAQGDEIARAAAETVGPETGAAVRRAFDELGRLDLEGVLGGSVGQAKAIVEGLRRAAQGGDPSGLAALASQVEGQIDAGRAASVAETLRRLAQDLEQAASREVGRGAAGALARALAVAETPEAPAAFAAALAAAEAEGSVAVAARAGDWLEVAAVRAERPAEAAAVAARVAGVADAAGVPAKAVRSRYDEALYQALAGGDGIETALAALARARELGDKGLMARGIVVLGLIQERQGDTAGALRSYDGVLSAPDPSGIEDEVADAAMGALRCLPPEATTDPRRVPLLGIVRAGARRRGDPLTFGQASVLLAESLDATDDRLGAVGALLEGREALRAIGPDAAEIAEAALRVLEADWGTEAFQALLREARARSSAD